MTIYRRAYPSFPARPDLVGTPWWRALVEEVAPQYAKLRQTFEDNTVLLKDRYGDVCLTYESGNHSYMYHRRQATAEVVLELITGVCALQAKLDKADASIGGSYRDCLVLDLSGVHVQGGLCPPKVTLPHLLAYRTQFAGDVDFSKCAFQGFICFEHCNFEGKTNFNNARLWQKSIFSHTVFRQEANFMEASGAVRFEHVVFLEFANFENAMVGYHSLVFNECTFLGATNFTGRFIGSPPLGVKTQSQS